LYLKPDGVGATEDALEAIQNADGIVIGPGSLYTSILPNLLIEDLATAVAAAPAPKIYICNVMTQPHETDRFSGFDHVNTIVDHTRPDILSHVIINNGQIPQNILKKYANEESYPVVMDTPKIRSLGYTVLEENIVNFADTVRHNPRRVSKMILEIVNTSKKKSSETRRKAIYAKSR
jgi:uncharacterized cofD-like protein